MLTRNIADGVATLTFNRPEARNALAPEMLAGLTEFLAEVERDPSVRCLLIAAVGDNFVAGGDIASFEPTLALTPPDRRAAFEKRILGSLPLYLRLERLPKPIVVAARGAIAGAGISLALAADYTLISDTAFYFFAHGHLGLSLDGALSYYLPRAVGLRKARELALFNSRVAASEALSLGLANRVVKDADLEAEAQRCVQQLCKGATIAIGHTKQLLEQSGRNTMAQQFEREAQACGASVATADFEEGVRAFLAKRKPTFRGS